MSENHLNKVSLQICCVLVVSHMPTKTHLKQGHTNSTPVICVFFFLNLFTHLRCLENIMDPPSPQSQKISFRARTECAIFLTCLPQMLAVYGTEYWTWIVSFPVSTCEMAVAVVEWWERHICIRGENCEMTDSGCDTEGMTN